jgi:hypothetical protein
MDSAEELFETQRNLLEYLICLGRELENKMFEELGKGSAQGEGESWIPLDEQLGIEKRHTPGFKYFLSSFTGREAYQESLNRFHEIFRPDGKHLASMRKALDMDYALGERMEATRQREIQQVFEKRGSVEVQRGIEGTMAVSVDATKVREKQGEYVDDPAGWLTLTEAQPPCYGSL